MNIADSLRCKVLVGIFYLNHHVDVEEAKGLMTWLEEALESPNGDIWIQAHNIAEGYWGLLKRGMVWYPVEFAPEDIATIEELVSKV